MVRQAHHLRGNSSHIYASRRWDDNPNPGSRHVDSTPTVIDFSIAVFVILNNPTCKKDTTAHRRCRCVVFRWSAGAPAGLLVVGTRLHGHDADRPAEIPDGHSGKQEAPRTRGRGVAPYTCEGKPPRISRPRAVASPACSTPAPTCGICTGPFLPWRARTAR